MLSNLFDSQQVGRRVRQLREQADLSQEQLAQMIGTKQPAIARLERGRVIAKLDLLHKIARALNVRLEVNFVVNSR